ncbi:MAG: hypothetical protein P8O16_04805 [Algoriphagus sp.]|jgi:hypothetical protein|uniref:hypothetical protein n=1 Tax=Algoriphagus sp. TaxID=1872435 RepID=UPI002607ACDF|nr:hypothetical protein [Algoriphagus sp.]MDG1276578.1 hypothetical protein [Algoriphagus sp.]
MNALGKIKSRLIDRIQVSENEKLLQAIETLLSSSQSEENLHLNSFQIEMLKMSQKDIDKGDLISEKELESKDEKWMK